MQSMANLKSLSKLSQVSGRFPRRALGLVLEWCVIHKAELLADWALAAEKLPLNPMLPLE